MGNQQPSLFEGEKTCRVCEKTKDIREFRLINNRGKAYRMNICIECDREWHKEHYRKDLEATRADRKERARVYRENNREAYNAKNRRFKMLHRERDRNHIYEAYGNKCACCGETNPGFFTVDHVNNDGHTERKNGLYTSGSQFYRQIIQQNFPPSYQILCYNCNMGRARNNGICPHQEGSTTILQESTAKQPEVPATPKKGKDIV